MGHGPPRSTMAGFRIRSVCSGSCSAADLRSRLVKRGLTPSIKLMEGVNPRLTNLDRRSAAAQLPEQTLRIRKPAIVDLGGPCPIDVEIGGVGDAALVLHEPVVHLLNEERVVAEIAHAPFG